MTSYTRRHFSILEHEFQLSRAAEKPEKLEMLHFLAQIYYIFEILAHRAEENGIMFLFRIIH